MFEFLKKNRIKRYTENASEYLQANFIPEIEPEKKTSTGSDVRYSMRIYNDDIKYSDRNVSDISVDDAYDSLTVDSLMKNYSATAGTLDFLKQLDKSTNKTFVDTLVLYINKKGLRDSEVYKAAQIDRRLFSKIMSDRQYKPAKDTAVAIAIALQLTLDEANDLLSRAGYTFSHSNKKDIIIEYFFRERIYNIDDINQVLFNLGQKIIGR